MRQKATLGCRRFPNARYLMSEADYRFFHPDTSANATGTAHRARRRPGRTDSLVVFEDSVVPVRSDQIELWTDDHRISESLRLRPAPGHTPGSSVLWLDAGRPAVFVGDLTHSPIQLHRPTDPCAFDEDFAVAAVTRKRSTSPRLRGAVPQ